MRITTTHLTAPAKRPALNHLQAAILIVALVIILSAGLTAYSRLPSSASALPAPTPGLIIVIATPPPVVPPTAVPVAQVAAIAPALPRFVVAFAAPGGDVLGPIPEPAASAILARYGNEWVMVSWQAGQVWIRAADIGLGLADVAPQIAPAPQVIYQVVNQAQEGPQEAAPAPIATAAPKYAPEPVALPTAAPLPAEYPTLAPMEQTDITKEWARQQVCAEHSEWCK